MYELQDSTITEINDATINGDFNWVLVTQSDNSCLMIMITKIRRKTYKCSNNLSFNSFRFISSDPILAGSDSSNTIHFARLLSDRFEIKWQTKLTGVTADEMIVYDSNDSSDESDVLTAISSDPNNYPMLLYYDISDGTVKKNKILEYSMTKLKINHSNMQKDYMLTGYIPTTGQMVFVRFDESFTFSDIRVTKANNQAIYELKPLSTIVDQNANIILGGTYNSKAFMLYKTGEELSAYSCVLANSSRVNVKTVSQSSITITQQDSNFDLLNDNVNAQWDNKTGRIFGFDSTYSLTTQCSAPLNAHWVKSRYLANRYNLKFDSVCDGTTSSVKPTNNLDISLSVAKRSNSVPQNNPELVIGKKAIEVVTTNLKQDTYLYSITVYDNSKLTSGYVNMTLEYNVGKSIFMVVLSVVYYLLFGVVIIDAILHNKYMFFKYFMFSSQLIHLTGLCDVKAPPVSVYFIQNIVISTFTHPLFTRLLADETVSIDEEYMYNAGIETSKALLTFTLTFIIFSIVVMIILGVCLICYINPRKFFNNKKRLEFLKKMKVIYWKEILHTIIHLMFPYILLLTIIDFIEFKENSGDLAVTSVWMSALILALTILFVFIFQISNLSRL